MRIKFCHTIYALDTYITFREAQFVTVISGAMFSVILREGHGQSWMAYANNKWREIIILHVCMQYGTIALSVAEMLSMHGSKWAGMPNTKTRKPTYYLRKWTRKLTIWALKCLQSKWENNTDNNVSVIWRFERQNCKRGVIIWAKKKRLGCLAMPI
jgi:hypothetical protein